MEIQEICRKIGIRLLYQIAPLIKSDKIFLKMLFPLRMGYRLNLDNPRTFSERLQWLKLNDRHPEYTKMVDKVAAKEYVAGVIGEKYIIPTLAVYNSAEEIDFDKLPNRFVLKCTHDSGGIVVCRDKSKLDINVAREKMHKGLKRAYFIQNREYPYKNVPRRIIAEQYMEDESGELMDYKFFCFDSKPKYLFVATDRFKKDTDTKFDFFDMEWNHLPFTNGHPNNPVVPQKPQNFELMKQIAERLSIGFPHIRVDLYNISGRVYFGELTFFHWSGMMPFVPMEWDYKFGESLRLPRNIEKYK
ncbi:MAG: ATP-grasp fold amidoligase family protein [Bacteroidales bacterium]|nr:ATP-grasp fold amidoligase family protein [Bacteroidales bacterium]